jgi:hypothetical protein
MSLIIHVLGTRRLLGFLVICQKWTCDPRNCCRKKVPVGRFVGASEQRYGKSAGARSILEQDSEQASGRASCPIEDLGGVVMGGYSRALLQPVRKACCVDTGLVVPSTSPLFMLDVVEGSVSQ